MKTPVIPLGLLLIAGAANANDEVVVIASGALPKVDLPTLQRLYTGRIVSVGQQAATPLNLSAGDPLRKRFLEGVLGQTEEQYTGYWLVRRYVGKGAPPQEFATVDEMLRQLASTPGAVAYVPVSKVPSGANIIYRAGGK
ncbi:MAG: hypothetical protein E6Q42_07745 [Dechloromonas sp.]|nr:MAG: hypothetical protein E6Q42_07745 [Dechloromonas sp.]